MQLVIQLTYGRVIGKYILNNYYYCKLLCFRWQQAPDRIKGHEPQYWTPLKFDENGTIEKMQWIDQFVLDV